MRKRIPLALSLVACLALLAYAALWLLSSQPGISRANYERIQVGMTQQEVERLLAGPPRPDPWTVPFEGGVAQIGHTPRVWADDDAGIRIDFDKEGRVAVTQWAPRRESWWNRVRAWIGR